jgi:hypothetical protein
MSSPAVFGLTLASTSRMRPSGPCRRSTGRRVGGPR